MVLNDFIPLPPDITGWQGDSLIFKELITEAKPKTIIEVGSWKGLSTITMAKYCQELGLTTKLYCVDTWLGALEFYTDPQPDRNLMKKFGYPQVYYQFISNLVHEGVEAMVETIPLPSHIAAKIVPSADLIYIDGSHEFEDITRDIELYSKKLNPGGILFGDDYGNPDFPGVRMAVDRCGFKVITDGWFWVIRGII